MKTILFWFRRDLRLNDNVGLYHARKEADRLITAFLVDPDHKGWKHHCGDRLQFKLNGLRKLRKAIRADDGNLIVRTEHSYRMLPEICREESVDKVVWNRSYEPYERKRDRRVQEALEKQGINWETWKDQVHFEKDEILTNEGNPYQVFTYYGKKWKNREKPESVPEVQSFDPPQSIEPGVIPSVGDLQLEQNLEQQAFSSGFQEAENRWKQFLDRDLARYEHTRDRPDVNGTSGLSPYLRFGMISPRRLVEDCREAVQNVSSSEFRSSIKTFVEELIWREFYQQILWHHPRVVRENFRNTYDDLPWENRPGWMDRWKSGRTGYPIVDAAMRQLNQIGWMHNRLRMIVASFLTKNCLIHWKKGETYFMNRLLDGDTAANNGGWQWAASTGTDAAPYFRIFNPIKQSRKHDPDGAFIRRYCPELSDLNDTEIHAPFNLEKDTLDGAGIQLGQTYPEPMLNHKKRREIALDTFKEVRE